MLNETLTNSVTSIGEVAEVDKTSNKDYSNLINLLEKNNQFNFDLYNQYLVELKEVQKISNEKIRNLAITELQKDYNFEVDLNNLTNLFDMFFGLLNITNITINSNISENKRNTSFVFNSNKIKNDGEVKEKKETSKRFDSENDLITYLRENDNKTSIKVLHKSNFEIIEVDLSNYKFLIKKALMNIGLTSFTGINIYRTCEKIN